MAEEAEMRTISTHDKHCGGQALVELAIILPLLLLLILGVFEFGRAMYVKNTLTHAARAGARSAVVTYGITNGSANVNTSCIYGTSGNDQVFKSACTSLYQGVRKNNVTISITLPRTPPTSGDMVTVSVVWSNYKTAAPSFIPSLNNITLKGETAMRYE